jgi:heptaprenyl diphosphate synthase
MQLQDKYRVAILSAYAISLHGFESLLPTPIPWLKLGLANIITLVALSLYGFRMALMVTLIRVVLASLFIGTFLGPAFILSTGGGIASVVSMGLIIRAGKNIFGTVGVSLIGALFHNIAQLSLAYYFFIQRLDAVLIISPVIILIGSLTGIINGITSDILIKNLLKKKSENIHNVTGN